MKALGDMVKAAKKPFMIVGGSRWNAARLQVGRRFCRAGRHSGRGVIPPRAAVSGRSSEFCRRPRHRPQSEARRAHQGGRPAAAGRRTHVGDAVVVLHADRRAEPEAEARTCASGRRRTRPRLSAGARHPGKPDRVCRKACDARHRPPRQCGGGGDGARGLSRLVGCPAKTAGTLPVRRGDVLAARPPAGGCDHLQRRRQLCRLDPSLLPLPRFWHAACADVGLDGLRRAGGGDGEAAAAGQGRRRVCGRRLFPDERPGVRDRRRSTAFRSSPSSSTTACTAPSACTRRTTIRAVSRRRI